MTWISNRALDRLRNICETPDLSGTRYRLLRELGRGGMGIVYLAEDRALSREVALKILDDPDEALVLARLEHPGIVPVHEVGLLPDGRTYYAMKRVAGVRLDQHITDSVSISERLRIFRKIVEAVAFAHSQGVVHCDLKPENVMIGSFGETLVLDWGLARIEGRPPQHAAGTPGYMAPEQRHGEPTPLSDVFGLGGILRFLLPPKSPKQLRAIAARALEPVAAARYPSAEELSAEVARFMDGERVLACPEGPLDVLLRIVRKHRMLTFLLLGYLVMRTILIFSMRR